VRWGRAGRALPARSGRQFATPQWGGLGDAVKRLASTSRTTRAALHGRQTGCRHGRTNPGGRRAEPRALRPSSRHGQAIRSRLTREIAIAPDWRDCRTEHRRRAILDGHVGSRSPHSHSPTPSLGLPPGGPKALRASGFLPAGRIARIARWAIRPTNPGGRRAEPRALPPAPDRRSGRD
jgi:hypothetical protein